MNTPPHLPNTQPSTKEVRVSTSTILNMATSEASHTEFSLTYSQVRSYRTATYKYFTGQIPILLKKGKNNKLPPHFLAAKLELARETGDCSCLHNRVQHVARVLMDQIVLPFTPTCEPVTHAQSTTFGRGYCTMVMLLPI